jgi:hypothetical protein
MADLVDAEPNDRLDARRDEIMSVRNVLMMCAAGALLFSVAFYASLSKKDAGRANDVTAVGQGAFIELLRAVNIRVDYLGDQEQGGLFTTAGKFVVLADPPHQRYLPAALKLLSGASAILIVLPKRIAIGERSNGFADRVDVRSVSYVQGIARSVVNDAILVRSLSPTTWQTNQIGTEPEIHDLQLVRSSKLKPIVAGAEGILVGELTATDGPRIFLLSDPDILANHGVKDGDNAVFAVRLIESLRPSGQPVLIDEGTHDSLAPPMLWASLFQLPLVVITISFLALFGVICLAALVRFGRPLPSPSRLAAGKELLLSNTANLIQSETSTALLVTEYVRNLKRDIASRFNAPAGLDGSALDHWLIRNVPENQTGHNLGDLQPWLDTLDAQAEADALSIVHAFYKWRGALLRDTR